MSTEIPEVSFRKVFTTSVADRELMCIACSCTDQAHPVRVSVQATPKLSCEASKLMVTGSGFCLRGFQFHMVSCLSTRTILPEKLVRESGGPHSSDCCLLRLPVGLSVSSSRTVGLEG